MRFILFCLLIIIPLAIVGFLASAAVPPMMGVHVGNQWAMFMMSPMGIAGVLVLGAMFVLILGFLAGERMLRGHQASRESSAMNAEQDEMLRQLWAAQDRMDERITNIETILMEKTRSF